MKIENSEKETKEYKELAEELKEIKHNFLMWQSKYEEMKGRINSLSIILLHKRAEIRKTSENGGKNQ